MKLIYVPAPVSDSEHSGGHTDEDERGERVIVMIKILDSRYQDFKKQQRKRGRENAADSTGSTTAVRDGGSRTGVSQLLEELRAETLGEQEQEALNEINEEPLEALADLARFKYKGMRFYVLAGLHALELKKAHNLKSVSSLIEFLDEPGVSVTPAEMSRRIACFKMVSRFPMLIRFQGDCALICKKQKQLSKDIENSPDADGFQENSPKHLTREWIINA